MTLGAGNHLPPVTESESSRHPLQPGWDNGKGLLPLCPDSAASDVGKQKKAKVKPTSAEETARGQGSSLYHGPETQVSRKSLPNHETYGRLPSVCWGWGGAGGEVLSGSPVCWNKE